MSKLNPQPQETLTSEVVGFILQQEVGSVPSPVLSQAKCCVLDGVAVMLAGAAQECATVVRKHLQNNGLITGSASLLGSPLQAPPAWAALANGVSGHAMDYDDTQLASAPDRVYGLLTHPTVPVLSACLALGQEMRTSGSQLLTAFAVGVEVECKLCEAIYPRHYQQGFHSTATFGCLGATAAACYLLRLKEQQVRMALGIAASQAAGIRVNFGTMTKPYHAGAAAQNGITAAQLAHLGFEASPDALDGPWGFFQVMGGGVQPEFIRGKLGNPWALLEPGISVKLYPCGSLLHPAMDTLRDLVIEHDLQADEIEEVRLGTTSNVLAALRYQRPQNALEAKFSIPFLLAVLILRRRAGIAEFQDQVVLDSQVRSLMERVHSYLDPELEELGFSRIRSRLTLKLRDGRILNETAEWSRGMPQRPVSWDDLAEKFRECARGVLSEDRMAESLQSLKHLEELEDINSCVALLGQPRPHFS